MARANDIAPAFGQALERARKEDQLSQQQLAAHLQISQSYLSKLLADTSTPSEEVARRIREYLGQRWPLYAPSSDDWLTLVAKTAQESIPFRELVLAALQLLKE